MKIQNDYTRLLKDSILENSAIRDELTDDEAQPLIDRGMELAALAGQDIQDEEVFEARHRAINLLLRTIARYVARRQNKDQEGLIKYLNKLDEYSETLGLLKPSPEEREALLSHEGKTNAEVMQALFLYYSPPKTESTPRSEETLTEETDQDTSSHYPDSGLN